MILYFKLRLEMPTIFSMFDRVRALLETARS